MSAARCNACHGSGMVHPAGGCQTAGGPWCDCDPDPCPACDGTGHVCPWCGAQPSPHGLRYFDARTGRPRGRLCGACTVEAREITDGADL